MKNPFSPDAFNVEELRRIPRDLSHRKVFTTEFGKGLPVLCQEVFPGDTIKIEDVDLAIQGMPTFFPLTSRLKVSVSYFYCRNRCVDEDWEDFIFNTKEVDKAWLRMTPDRARTMISTGSLGDMFGLPSTVGEDGKVVSRTLKFSNPVWVINKPSPFVSDVDYVLENFLAVGSRFFLPINSLGPAESFSYNRNSFYSYVYSNLLTEPMKFTDEIDYISIPLSGSTEVTGSSNTPRIITIVDDSGVIRYSEKCTITVFENSIGYVVPLSLKSFMQDFSGSYRILLSVAYCLSDGSFYSGQWLNTDLFTWYPDIFPDGCVYPLFTSGVLTRFVGVDVVDSTDSSVIDNNIFVGAAPLRKVEAHAFRHYTMIGNYYYRNDRNNPYVLNGEVQYNKFIPTKASGPDDNVYDYWYRNWELDRFTSCCQTPQFGDAPLVGLTYNPNMNVSELTFQAADEGGTTHEYKVKVGVGDDYKLNSIADFDKEIPAAVLQNVTNMIAYGTSINDIRVTNSFQRFLERAQRGLRYRHQMKSHLGVSVDYPDIDIPQYIGGFNGEINSYRNENTAASEYANLGDFNGSLFGNFRLSNPITVKVPEHGYIMGIMTITPVPMYPQSVTNKALIKRSPFEYPLQEFFKVGNVPVDYGEVMPLQNAPGQSPDDVFGYQRPWYEYLNNLDEVHGDFRTTLAQFNCVRMFASRPDLSAQFTTVHPEELNQIFISNNIADKYGSNSKFLCRIDYKMTGLRQIPEGDPALE